MPDIASIIETGAINPWLYLPLATLLGALHALEPGHSKTMMAGFIVAIRGTPAQATLLGLSAAVGHTIVVWALALLGLYLGDRLILDRAEPWLILASGVLIMALALRIFLMIRAAHHAHHDHHLPYPHAHAGDLDFHTHGHHHPHGHDHHEDGHQHPHGSHAPAPVLDAHAAAHERDLKRAFQGKNVTTLDVLWFGFTGGLLPCPAAIAVLLICLQLRALTLGIGMVAAFSIGLAITLVGVGLVAAWGHRAVSTRWSGLAAAAERLPYISAALVFALGTFVTLRGLSELGAI